VGKIVITTNATLDGVVEDPDGKEGFDRGGWFYRFGEADVPSWDVLSTKQAMEAEALLLGRRTDTWFGTRERPGEWADRTLAMPKYVVSTTNDKPAWQNSTVLNDDAVEQISELKAKLDGEILVYGRLLDDLTEVHPMRLTDLRRVGDGIMFYTYEFEKN
jgi:dihydrofolate reductase